MSKNDRHHFLVVFILFCLGILILLSLVPTASKPNLLGTPGSLLSYFLYAGFGLCSWVFPAVLFWVAYSRFKDEPLQKPGLKLMGLLLTILSVCVLTQVFFPGVQMFSPSQMREGVEWSGQLGLQLGTRMESVLTRFGTVVICLMILVLSAWLLEKEGHLLQAAKRAWEGFQKGGRYLEENGFGVVSALRERLGKAFQDFQQRQQAKRVADEAHEKLEKRQRPSASPPTTEVPPTPAPRVAPPVKTPGKVLFTGESEEEKPPLVEPLEEDVVSAAMAEAKGSKNSMTTKQKMEAASIEMAEEEGKALRRKKPPNASSDNGNCLPSISSRPWKNPRIEWWMILRP